MKKITLFLSLLWSCIVFAQWNQLGTSVKGIASNDKLGDFNSIAIDSDGSTIAVGSSRNSDLGQFFGYAKVLDWNGSQWIQRGNTFQGSSLIIGTGSAVDLSADGNTVVISSPWSFNSLGYKCGVVNVYDWNGSLWVQRGLTIEGEGNINPLFSDDIFGRAISLSPDGNYLAIGAPSNTQQVGVLQLQGQARVYHWDGQNWMQMGQDIDAEISLEEFGSAIDISADGTKLAVGGRGFKIWIGDTPVADQVGKVRNYEWNGTSWILRGTPLIGLAVGDNFGTDVSLNDDGNILAISSNKTNGSNSSTQIFNWNGTEWIQQGNSIIGGSNSFVYPSNDLNANGNIVAIGEPSLNSANGRAKTFQWNGNQWVQIGNTMQSSGSTSAINGFGTSVRISASGSKVAIGASSQIVNGLSSAGQVYVFNNTTVLNLDNFNSIETSFSPNPTTDFVNFKSSQIIERITIYNILGQEVFFKTINTNEFIIDISNQAKGTYIAKLNSDNYLKTIKLVKL